MSGSSLHKRLGLLAIPFMLAVGGISSASVHTYYDVRQQDLGDGFSASWLHTATSSLSGSPGNGALLNGDISSRLAGSFEGDLSGSVLLNISGSVSGKLKQLKTSLNDTFATNFGMSDSFELRLGGLANGGKGALAFETNGAGTGEYTGGFLDFSLFVAGSATSLLDGTFFFKPQAETAGSDPLSPNRGTSYASTLWGFNWMHDGSPMDDGTEPNWASFLSSLGYTGPEVLRTSASGPPLSNPLGLSLYVVDPPPGDGLLNPEPTTLVIWGLLAVIGMANYGGRGTRLHAML